MRGMAKSSHIRRPTVSSRNSIRDAKCANDSERTEEGNPKTQVQTTNLGHPPHSQEWLCHTTRANSRAGAPCCAPTKADSSSLGARPESVLRHAGECRTHGASGLFFQATQRSRAGLTFAAPTVLAGWRGEGKTRN